MYALHLYIGREKGPDGTMPILCVDGPHSAPAEHYTSYGTILLVGAGIGLTPCASILTALTRYLFIYQVCLYYNLYICM